MKSLSLFLSGSTRTDFAPQLEKLNKEKYTVYAFDPRGYGRSIPPTRDWPLLFLQRDAEDAVTLMKVSLIGSVKQAEKNMENVLTETRWDTNTKQLKASAQNIFIQNKTTSQIVLILFHLVILTTSHSLFSKYVNLGIHV